MTQIFPVPPTFASPVIVNPQTGQNQFNPIWLQWFLVLAQFLQGTTTGRIKDVIPVTTSGTYVATDGTNNLICLLWGAGGGGGPAPITGAAQCSIGGGGGAGAFLMAILTTGFNHQLLTIGAPGTSGVAGGATTFAGLTAGGGQPGNSSAAGAAPEFALGGVGGISSGGIVPSHGAGGLSGFTLNLSQGISGQGASSAWGQGGMPILVPGAGNNAAGPAAGGGGAFNTASTGTATAGGTGGAGFAALLELS